MKRGEVRIARIANLDGSPPKHRPVVVVQSDYYNTRISNVLVAQVTTTLVNQADPAHLLIDVSTPEGRQTGLRQTSLVSCINLSVIPMSDATHLIGTLSDDLQKQLNGCLKHAQAIS